MSVYNGERFLDQAINSIRIQSYSEFEFVIVDDGSTDATPTILSAHATADSRIRILRQENRGLIESLNRGFAAATGTYIARMDADDLAKPYRLEKQLDFLNKNPSIGLVGGAVEIIDAEARVLGTIRLPSEPKRVRRHMRELGCALAHPTVLFSRSILRDLGGFRKAYRHAEDYDLWLRMLEKVDLANLDEVLLGYRRHEASISFKNAKQQALSALCARTTAKFRLEGRPDPTSNVDLITEAVLRDLGIAQETIDNAIFDNMVLQTEDAIRCGLCSVAAEFPRMARPHAVEDKLAFTSLELNRKAAEAPALPTEKRKHRTTLLMTDPTAYWELFRPGGCTQNGKSNPSPALEDHDERKDGIETDGLTLSEILRRNRYDTDKSDEYLRNYERAWGHLRGVPIALLEIGVNKGGSLLLWRDYFTQGQIFGVDLHPPADLFDSSGRIRVVRGDQGNAAQMDAIASQANPLGFDIIIDDASHIGLLTAATFQILFYKHLKPGGFYCIEDWGTGYWESWPDGARPAYSDLVQFKSSGNQFPSHESGMVGLMKQLLDECALRDILHPKFGLQGNRRSFIRSIHFSSGLAIIEKTLG
jgi:hypothetical protein